MDPLVRTNLATEYALRSTVPLAMVAPEGLICAGTGTLFEIEGRYYILTASHVCDEGDLTTLFVPARGDLGDRIPCSSGRVTRPKDRDDVDVASIELTELSVYELLRHDYRFVTLDRIDLRGPADPAYIMGYPKKNYPTTQIGIVRAMTLQCPLSPTPADVDPPAVPDLDFFYDYPRSAYLYRGAPPEEVSSPSVKGMSGASVWAMLKPEGHWSPAASLFITGIQTAYKPGAYVRAQSWWAVVRLLCLQGDNVAAAFSKKTGCSVEELTRKAADIR